MKRHQIILHRKQLECFLKRLRCVIWVSLVSSLFLFIMAILYFYNKMFVSAAFTATAAYLLFKFLSTKALSITKKWTQHKGGQEEMLVFLDKEMKNRKPKEFFSLLEKALNLIDD